MKAFFVFLSAIKQYASNYFDSYKLLFILMNIRSTEDRFIFGRFIHFSLKRINSYLVI